MNEIVNDHQCGNPEKKINYSPIFSFQHIGYIRANGMYDK
jgi:hypothetical protein